MKSRIFKCIALIFIIALLITWLVLSAVHPNCFWGINFQEWIKVIVTLVLGVVFAFILVERNNKSRMFKTVIIDYIDSLLLLLDNNSRLILEQFANKDWKIQILTSVKTISNELGILKKYKEKLNADDELTFINDQFIEFRVLVTECIDDLRKDTEKREKTALKISLISTKLKEIKLKQFI